MTRFLKFLSTVRWQDLVDIIINSYILFRVYVLFHGTNAFRVLVGITSLWILQEVAASMGLILTSWAVRGITTAAAVIIIVVFRNEIRSALQVRNLKSLYLGFSHPGTGHPGRHRGANRLPDGQKAHRCTPRFSRQGRTRVNSFMAAFPGTGRFLRRCC